MASREARAESWLSGFAGAGADPVRGASALNLRVLTPFQRALLVIDGTVTRFIEAYTLEPVDIRRVSQTSEVLSEDHPWLEARAGSEIAVRRVLIHGSVSGLLYVVAESLIVSGRLPPDVRQRLEIQGEGLGQALHAAAVETRREILWYGKESTSELSEEFALSCGQDFITRAYRIIASEKPLALIQEWFPGELESLPLHH